jgi:hypothetical protein
LIKKFGLKYLAVLGTLSFLFSQFIACGAQFYKVSLEDDVAPPPGASVSSKGQDPSSPSFGIHAASGWSKLPIDFYTGQNLSPDQVEQLRVAMDTFEWALGWESGTLFNYMGKHANRTGDSFPDLYSSLEDGQNGHYADFDWSKTQKNYQVLATTIWANAETMTDAIESADIRFNTEYYNIGDSYYILTDGDREVVDMLSLALHELGHLLGLQHIEEEVDVNSVMNPRLFIGEGLAQRSLSEGDIRRLQMVYPCREDACDIDYLMTQVQPSEKYDSKHNKRSLALQGDEEIEAH